LSNACRSRNRNSVSRFCSINLFSPDITMTPQLAVPEYAHFAYLFKSKSHTKHWNGA
jgi:hypothetical protein